MTGLEKMQHLIDTAPWIGVDSADVVRVAAENPKWTNELIGVWKELAKDVDALEAGIALWENSRLLPESAKEFMVAVFCRKE